MKLVLKKLSAVAIVLMFVATCFVFAGCSLFDKLTAKHVSTLEELKSAGGKLVVLDNDIDGNFANLDTLIGGVTFDGQGHTISNLLVSNQENGLFKSTTVKNVTLENITLSATGIFAGIVAGYGREGMVIDNVHVVNSKIIANQKESKSHIFVGGIVGSCIDYHNEYKDPIRGDHWNNAKSPLSERNNFDILNCTVDGLEVEVTGKSGSADIYVGGIAGIVTANITGCWVKNSTLTAESKLPYNEIFMGGITSYLCGTATMEACYTENNTFNATASYYSEGTFGYQITSNLVLGGAVGVSEGNAFWAEGSKVKACYSSDNTLNAYSTGQYYVGGFAGQLNSISSHSYSANNEIVCKGRRSGDKESANRYAGGFAGVALNGSSFLSCYAFGNSIADEAATSLQSKECRHGGFFGVGETKVVANFCAAGNTTFATEESNAKQDEFCPTTINVTATNCYITTNADANEVANVNGCALKSLDDWYNPATIRAMLNLSDTRWVISSDKLPYLKFD